jgi:hypothetical protein
MMCRKVLLGLLFQEPRFQAVAEDAVAVSESRSWFRSRWRLRSRTRSLLESVAAL